MRASVVAHAGAYADIPHTKATKRLKILAPMRYGWRFNGPRETMHDIETRLFAPLNKVSKRIEGITFFNPFPIRKFDLIHAFNRIPLSTTPFVIGFESHLPRAYGLENTRYFRFLTRRLASDTCRKIVCISEHARTIFKEVHKDNDNYTALSNKLMVRYPNVLVPEVSDIMAGVDPDPVVVTFVGNHFGRKGGCVALKMAEIAANSKFPLFVNIVSTLEVGEMTWTDPTDRSFFKPYFKLLNLPNVKYYNSMPNSEVLQLLRKSHFSVLATFSDTFGFSAIESMVNYAPVIATKQGALPEFINSENGILLDLPTTHLGEWVRPEGLRRDDERYMAVYRKEVERLAEEGLSAIIAIVEEPGKLASLRKRARDDAAAKFNHRDAAQFWDNLYTEVVDKQ